MSIDLKVDFRQTEFNPSSEADGDAVWNDNSRTESNVVVHGVHCSVTFSAITNGTDRSADLFASH
jgi:CMP-2-keto-3-deoxyoctulosonic acid synthetase